MGRKATITPELYDKLLVAYRETPGNASNAARQAGTTAQIASRCWSRGYLPKHVYARPIREVLREEVDAARAARQRAREKEIEDEEKDREKVRKDSIETITEEAMGSRIARKNAVALGGIMATILRGLQPVAEQVREALIRGDIKPKEGLKIINDITFALKQSNEAMRVSFELERLRLGEPTQILGLASTTDDASAEEIAEELMSLQRTLQRAARQTSPSKYGQAKRLPDGTIVIDLPTEAFEEVPTNQEDPHKA